MSYKEQESAIRELQRAAADFTRTGLVSRLYEASIRFASSAEPETDNADFLDAGIADLECQTPGSADLVKRALARRVTARSEARASAETARGAWIGAVSAMSGQALTAELRQIIVDATDTVEQTADGERLVAALKAFGASRSSSASGSRPHINPDGKFQSDKYPTCPAGKVPLSVTDPTAQDLLWQYAQRRREVDADFASDLEFALVQAGFVTST